MHLLTPMIGGGEGNGDSSKPANRKKWASHSSNAFTDQLVKYHLFNTTQSVSSHASDRTVAINRTQTIKVQLKDGSNWVDATVVPADLTASTYAMTDNSTAVSAASASLAKESATVSATVDAAYSATVSLSCTNVLDGYLFDGWYDANGNKITSYTVSAAVTVYARFIQTAEETHPVTVSYKCGETELQASQTLSVGESTANTAEAPEFKDYTFSGWELGSGVQSVDATANPISITTKASGEYTLVANYNYIEPVIKTIYCKMEYNWWTKSSAAISAFISGTYGESATSLGTLMTLAPLEGNVWKIDVDVARYQKIRFIRVNPEGTSDWGARTGLVEIPTDDKNLYTITQSTDKWSGDCPGTWSVYEAPAAAPKRYITGTIVGGWVGNEVEMTYDNASSTYSHTFSALTVDTEYKLKVTDGTWNNHWGTINGTIEGVSNDGDGNVCFKLSTVGDVTVTFDGAKITVSTTGAFYVPTVYDYYIVGSMNSWNQTDENYGMSKVGETTTYSKELTLADGTYEFKVKGNSWYGYTDIVGEYEEISEGKDGEGNPNGNVQLKLTASKTFIVNFDSNTKKITFEGLTEIVPKYYLVGTFNEWNTADPNYEMTLEGGVYKKEVTFAKDVEFKVCDGTWSNHWGKNNLGGIQYNELTEKDDNIKMKEAKTFTVIFNPAENLILFEGLTEKVTYVLMGVNGDWDNGIELTPNPKKAGEYMLLAQTIAKATDAVKIVKIEGGNKTQYCQFENVKDGSVTCTEGTHKNIVLEDGIYNFYYTTNDNKVYIETSTPAHTRTVPAGYYATVCLPNNIINVVGATLFEVAGKEGNKVIFDEVLTPVAGMPYIFLAEENTISFYCGIETAATPGNHESLHGTFEDMVDADLDGMYMVQNNKIVKCAATGCNIPANRAYFNGTELKSLGSAPAPMPGRRRITMGAESENTATGVEGIIVPEGQTIKVISNGQLIIIRNGEMYNAQGIKL